MGRIWLSHWKRSIFWLRQRFLRVRKLSSLNVPAKAKKSHVGKSPSEYVQASVVKRKNFPSARLSASSNGARATQSAKHLANSSDPTNLAISLETLDLLASPEVSQSRKLFRNFRNVARALNAYHPERRQVMRVKECDRLRIITEN